MNARNQSLLEGRLCFLTWVLLPVSVLFALLPLKLAAQPGSFDWARKTTDAAGTAFQFGSPVTVAVAVDHEGNLILVTNERVTQATLAKSKPTGDVLWSKTVPMPGVEAIHCDDNGNIYLAGGAPMNSFAKAGIPTEGSGGAYMAKLDSTGTILWVRLHGNTPYSGATGFTFDRAGNYFLIGSYRNGTAQFGDTILPPAPSNSPFNYVVKCDADGRALWARTTPLVVYGVSSIATDAAGNLFLPGNVAGDNGLVGLMHKIDPAGNLLWVAQPPDATHGRGVVVDNQGAAFLAYWAGENVGVAKFSASGELLWNRTSSVVGSAAEAQVALNAEGDCLLAAAFTPGGTSTGFKGAITFGEITLSTLARWEVCAVKFSSSGDLRWAVQSMGKDPAGNGVGKTRISVTQIGSIASSPLGGFVLAGPFVGTVDFGTTQLVGPNYDSPPVPFVAHLSDPPSIRPELQIDGVAGKLVLHWPAAVVAYVLESTDALSGDDKWALEPNSVLEGDQQTVTLPLPSSPRFFRLRKN